MISPSEVWKTAYRPGTTRGWAAAAASARSGIKIKDFMGFPHSIIGPDESLVHDPPLRRRAAGPDAGPEDGCQDRAQDHSTAQSAAQSGGPDAPRSGSLPRQVRHHGRRFHGGSAPRLGTP